LDQSWATVGLAALGFPNGAENGEWSVNMSDLELLHVLAHGVLLQYSYYKLEPQSMACVKIPGPDA
jgi:hypothetical protein